MPAFNFKGQFVERINAGTKGGTIRNYGKRAPVREGQTLYLYTGQRTKWCRKIKDAPCVEVWDVHVGATIIALKRNGASVVLDTLTELNQFAITDGFPDWNTMKRYWELNGGLPFNGFHARWIPLKDHVNVNY